MWNTDTDGRGWTTTRRVRGITYALLVREYTGGEQGPHSPAVRAMGGRFRWWVYRVKRGKTEGIADGRRMTMQAAMQAALREVGRTESA